MVSWDFYTEDLAVRDFAADLEYGFSWILHCAYDKTYINNVWNFNTCPYTLLSMAHIPIKTKLAWYNNIKAAWEYIKIM